MLFFCFFFAFRTENLFKQVAALCRCRRVVAALLTSQLASLPLHFGAARELLLFLPNYMAAICSTRIAADVVSYTPLSPLHYPLHHLLRPLSSDRDSDVDDGCQCLSRVFIWLFVVVVYALLLLCCCCCCLLYIYFVILLIVYCILL